MTPDISPTMLAINLRRQWSDEHVYDDSGPSSACARCGRRRRHPDHVTRDQDRATVMAMRDRIGG